LEWEADMLVAMPRAEDGSEQQMLG